MVALALPCVTAAMVAMPALRLGGEWAGNVVSFSELGVSKKGGAEELISETWMPRDEEGVASIKRRTVRVADAVVSEAVLPRACSSATVLQPGNMMMEPEVKLAELSVVHNFTSEMSKVHCLAQSGGEKGR